MSVCYRSSRNSCLAVVICALLGAGVSAWAGTPTAEVDACIRGAAAKHGINYELVRSIAEQESAFNPHAVGSNTNGSQDFGLMQINSTWLPTLRKYGVKQQDLFNPCISADVGTWILADNFRRMGVTWEAVGAYNAVTQWKRVKYATGVYNRLVRFVNNPQGHAVAAKQTTKPRSHDYSQPAQENNQRESADLNAQVKQIASWEVQQ